jgi:hypothetical protein
MTARPLAWIVLSVLLSAGCNAPNHASDNSQSLDPTAAAAVVQQLTAFMAEAARDVTQQGPLAWNKYFEETPSFFMAVNGQMAFPNGAAAREGMPKVAETIKHIDLKWGDDLRVDPLSPKLGVVAASWRETQVATTGHSVDENGFFTALVECRDGHWQFRDAHWSSPVPAANPGSH